MTVFFVPRPARFAAALGVLLLFVLCPLRAATHPGQAELVREVARDTGKSPEQLNKLLDGAHMQQSILDAISRPAESKPWKDYRPIFLTQPRIDAGVAFYREHQALLARMLIGLLMIALLMRSGVPRWGGWQTILAAVLSAGLLLSFSAASHAAAQPQPSIDITLDWLHLMATALWVGGLALLVRVLPALRRALAQKERAPILARIISRFSTLALVSVAVLTLTGTYAALQHIATASELLTSDYGRTLLIKLVLFIGLVLLGAYNLLIVRPRMGNWAEQGMTALESWQRRIQQSLRGEVVLALLVVLAVGLLTTLAPPTDQQPVAAAQPVAPTTMIYPTITPLPTRTIVPSLPFDETKTAADLKVRLQVAPASLGDNQFTVTATNAAGQPVETQLVRLRFTMTTMDMGESKLVAEPQGDGRYILSASPMSMVGAWQVEVTVRRATADDVVVPFVVPVGE